MAAASEGLASEGLAIHDFDGPRSLAAHDLPDGRVHLWRVGIDRLPMDPGELFALLSADERERARAMASETCRRRYVAVRGLLRLLLAAHTGLAPERIGFAYNPHGKPSLSPAASSNDEGPRACAAPLGFGIAHSGRLALLAIRAGGEVGVDVEYERAAAREAEIAARFFSSEEAGTVRERSGPERRIAFYRLWTRKEAYVKARGRGLAVSFPRFTVSADACARLLADEEDPAGPDEWLLADVPVPVPFYAACAWNRARSRRQRGIAMDS